MRSAGAGFETGVTNQTAYLYWPSQPGEAIEFDQFDLFERELSYFAQCVGSDSAPPLITPDEARHAVGAALAMRASLESGQIHAITNSRE